MSTIAESLASLGLSKHSQRFEKNDFDLGVLRDLADQDLKDIGISLAHRRKLPRAIAELAGSAEHASGCRRDRGGLVSGLASHCDWSQRVSTRQKEAPRLGI